MMHEGWVCPKCGVANAPSVLQCNCMSSTHYETSTSTDTEDRWPWPLVEGQKS